MFNELFADFPVVYADLLVSQKVGPKILELGDLKGYLQTVNGEMEYAGTSGITHRFYSDVVEFGTINMKQGEGRYKLVINGENYEIVTVQKQVAAGEDLAFYKLTLKQNVD